MKTKISLLCGMLIALFLFDGTAFAQMGGYGGAQNANTSATKPGANPSAAPAEKKPGTVLTGGAIVATPITEEEAKKKYPMPGGKPFPLGERDNHQPSGWIFSPYSRQLYDCSNIPQGGLALDTRVNKVFIRPKTK